MSLSRPCSSHWLVSSVECGTEGVAARINVEVVGEGCVREMHGDFVAHGLLQAGEGSKFAVTPRPGDGRLQHNSVMGAAVCAKFLMKR